VPAALAISALAPWAVTPLLMAGGAFLCYEGFEKLAHRWLHSREHEAHREQLAQAAADPAVDLLALEREKIKGAVRTDFILSAEIIVISLGTVATAPLPQRVAVLVGIALLMTVGVYGLVAGIVKLDDAGLHLKRSTGDGASARGRRALGGAILRAAPYLMKGLAIAGTAAMFLVGGGILAHGVPAIRHAVEAIAQAAGALAAVVPLMADGLIGVAAGALSLAAVSAVQRLRRPN